MARKNENKGNKVNNVEPATVAQTVPMEPAKVNNVEPATVTEPVTVAAISLHDSKTEYVNAKTLTPNVDNARLSTGEYKGIAVRSSFRIGEMADAILRDGDILEPLLVCGNGCASKRGTVLKGHIRLGAWQQLESTNKLPDMVKRGIPVEFRDNLTKAQESALLHDHNVSTPLSPTECFALLLARQNDGLSDMEIATRWPHLVAGYLGESTGTIPTDENERQKWYDKKRDTLAYNVLFFGRCPAPILQAKILLIQEQKEGLFAGLKEKPVYKPFKPTAQRAKELYSAYRKDRENGTWKHQIGGTEFDKLVAQFVETDFPTVAVEPVATVERKPITANEVKDIQDFIGESVPFANAVLSYVATGERPADYDQQLSDARFSAKLFDLCRANLDKLSKVLPVEIVTAIREMNGEQLTVAFQKMA